MDVTGEHVAPEQLPPVPASGITIVELDFVTKSETKVSLERVHPAIAEGRFVWIDVDVQDVGAIRAVLGALNLCNPEIVEDALLGEAETHLARYNEYLHLVLASCHLDGPKLQLERLDAVFGARFLLTIHRGRREFLESVRREYGADFQRFAQSPSFLLYELWDHLTEHYISTQKRLERRVEKLQGQLIGDSDDRVFGLVSELGENLLHFRSVLMPTRTVLTELSTRRSIFVSEATQQFLGNMVGVVENVLQDVLVDRDILAQSLNLYMSMVTHKTNRAMNKLTIFSAIFLPLSFLCGVYGMNFEVLPELKWRYGYVFFWVVVAAIVSFAMWAMRRAKLL